LTLTEGGENLMATDRRIGEARIDLRRTRTSLFYLAAYLIPLGTGLLLSPTRTFHLLGSNAEHATTPWRLFGGLLFILAIVVVRLIRERRSAAYINTVIARVVFVGLFSYLVGKTGNQAYIVVLIVLGFGEAWSLIALALDLREWIVARQNPMGDRAA
jgi:hypothetical protein